jgi:hypothetical protein
VTGTTRRLLPDAAHGADGETLHGLILRCRGQARLALFVRWGVPACTIGAAIAGVVSLSSQHLAWPWAIAGGAIVALVAAAAVWRTPNDLQVAAVIDRRLRLDDSVVAALQVHGTDALVSSLVVRHAIGLTRGVDARSVFPLEVGRLAAAAGIAALLLLGTALAGRSTFPPPGSAAGQVIAGDTTSGGPTAEAGTKAASSTRSARGGEAATDGRTGPEAVPQVAPDRTDGALRSPASSTSSALRRPSGDTANTGSTRSEQSAALPLAGPRDRGRSAGSADGGSRDDPRGQGGSGRGTPGTGGQGASGVGRGSGAGGVRGGTLIAAGTPFEADRTGLTRNGGGYSQAGHGGAAAAMAPDDVPPDLRSYVRDYFAAIASAAEGK